MEPLGATQFALLLHSVPQIGEKALGRLLRLAAQKRLNPNDCLNLTAEEWKSRYELHPRAAEYLAGHGADLRAKSAELARLLRAHSLSLLTVESASYPLRIERFEEAPPPILYALGQLLLLEPTVQEPRFTFTLAVSNDVKEDVLEQQDALASALVEAGGIPVTGHDRLPYQRLALCAQRRNRPILYVFDRGLREALGPEFDRPPFAAARIREAVFLPERDLALSPFRLEDHGLGANNRRRDRLIFSLADVVVCVAVRPGGTMAAECLRAVNQKRPVFIAPGRGASASALQTAGCPVLPEGDNGVAVVVQAVAALRKAFPETKRT